MTEQESFPKPLMLAVAVPFTAICLITVAASWLLREEPWRGKFSLMYASQFFLHDPQAANLLIGIVTLVFLWSVPYETTRKALDWIASHVGWIALALVVLLAVGTLAIYQNHRLSGDETYLYFQAQTFAAGRLEGRFPPELLPRLIAPYLIDVLTTVSPDTGRVISAYWPGFSLLLTPFVWLGIPWLLNPLLSGGVLLLVFRLTKDLTGNREIAAWAALFTLASPAFTVQGISYFAMQAHLFFNLLFVFLLLQEHRHATYLAGLVGGYALVLHNPVPHTAFALPWIIWQWRRLRPSRERLLLLAGYLTVAPALGLGWLWLRKHLQGHAAAGLGSSSPFSLESLIETIQPNLAVAFAWPSSDTLVTRFVDFLKLNAWAAPGLVFLAWLGLRESKAGSPARTLGWSALTTFTVFFFVKFDQNTGWGHRYFHSAWGVLSILAALGMNGERLRSEVSQRIVFTMTVLSLVLATGLRFHQVRSLIRAHLEQSPCLPEKVSQVCFLRPGGYRLDLIQNDPLLRSPRIMLQSRGVKEDERTAQRLLPGARLARNWDGQTVWVSGKRASLQD